MNGTVKKVVPEKGFGFIKKSDGGGDRFFHCSSLTNCEFDYLAPGMLVEFDEEPSRIEGKSPRAVNVRVLA